MVVLGAKGAGRRMRQAGIRFDGFVKDLDVPVCSIECRDCNIQAVEDVHTFDDTILTVVEMPSDDLVFIGVGFFLNSVIEDQYALIRFNRADRGL